MPAFPVIDAHVHLWDPGRLSYGWHRGNPLLDRAWLAEDYRQACGAVEVDAMVFVECLADRGLARDEVRFVEREARRDAGIKAIVARADLEEGDAALSEIERLKARTPLLRGIRRIIEIEDDPRFCLQPAFTEAVKALADLGLSFEITANHRHMNELMQFVERVGDVSLMLDHCGKPGIRDGLLEPWRSQMRALADHPNLLCKLSGLATEAHHDRWTEADLRPYIDAAVDAFGFERLVYGGDWPVCLQATTLPAWVALLDRCFRGVPAQDLARFYRSNAIDFYHLDIQAG